MYYVIENHVISVQNILTFVTWRPTWGPEFPVLNAESLVPGINGTSKGEDFVLRWNCCGSFVSRIENLCTWPVGTGKR